MLPTTAAAAVVSATPRRDVDHVPASVSAHYCAACGERAHARAHARGAVPAAVSSVSVADAWKTTTVPLTATAHRSDAPYGMLAGVTIAPTTTAAATTSDATRDMTQTGCLSPDGDSGDHDLQIMHLRVSPGGSPALWLGGASVENDGDGHAIRHTTHILLNLHKSSHGSHKFGEVCGKCSAVGAPSREPHAARGNERLKRALQPRAKL